MTRRFIGTAELECSCMDDQRKKKDLTVADVICRWYVCAVIGFGAGQSLGGGPSGLIGLVVGALLGWFLQKNHEKADRD